MTESEWLESADPARMLEFLCDTHPRSGERTRMHPGDRKLRLYACAAFRATGGGSWSVDAGLALALAEQHADYLIDDRELSSAWANFPDHLVAEYLLRPEAAIAAISLTRHRFPGEHADANGEADSWEVAGVLRDIIGNPFRTVPYWEPHSHRLSRNWWIKQIRSLADAAYNERLSDGMLDPLRLAVLADALEESGCDSREILPHLRSPGPHWRGCWVVDLLLRKE